MTRAWRGRRKKGELTIEDGGATISPSPNEHAYFDLDHDLAGMPDVEQAALAATIDLSQLQLPPVPEHKWSPHIKDNGFELLRVHGPPSNGRVASLVPYRKESGSLVMILTYNSDEGHIKELDTAIDLPDDGQPHDYIVGFPMKGKDGDGDVFVCVDGDLKLTASLSKMNLTTTDVSVVRLGFVTWGANVGGSLLINKMLMYVPSLPDVYVDDKTGADTNDGATPQTALASVVRAAEVARPGTTVHIAKGIYRGALKLRSFGQPGKPIKFVGEGRDATAIVGSIRADSLTWTLHKDTCAGDNLYKADVTKLKAGSGYVGTWSVTKAPHFVCESKAPGKCTRKYHLARSPNYRLPDADPAEEYKYLKHWYLADGGDGVPDCTPSPGSDKYCDESNWSFDTLTDVGHFNETGDPQPAATLKTLPDLVGANITINDGRSGFWTKQFTVKSHNKAEGKITIDGRFYCRDPTFPGIRAYAHYYVSNKLSFLDSPGEYWFDETSNLLYVWKSDDAEWSDIEISTDATDQEIGLDMVGKSYIEWEGLTFSFFYQIVREPFTIANPSEHNTFNNCRFHSSAFGIKLQRKLDSSQPWKKTRHWSFTKNEWSSIDEEAVWIKAPDGRDPDNGESSIRNLYFFNNSFHHIGFAYECPYAVAKHAPAAVHICYATNVTFIYNTIEIVAGYALIIRYGLHGNDAIVYPNIKASAHGDNLVARNNISRACLIKADAGRT
ncbi:unnamed protein product [Vitrella brassicaformis CCMP3155]|uniref:Right handed beta helix domain-containing protein n=1 Tax=Vitrella brassicaformis (strain CCMP3155) TaxID=1169540 RepID=A0A0G4E942_VITBC|nr:unnamed protein product [Vitrella brassicaformis CCMP3155]|eukprot:CEL92436.1 unnamed protein product [Vitrella brassicaformis CCMP3155]